jgi:anaerobic magnesium-protoporphyrin IX monomethyl ester cyclase
VPKNLFRFEIGIQTVNQKANLEVSRKQNFEKTTRIIRAVENHVELHLDLIVGMALDEWSDIKYSIEEVFKLFAPELQLGFLKFLKGTPVRAKAEQHGFNYDPMPPYQIIESQYLSKFELEQIVKLEHALEIYWNGKKAIHTLKYVTSKYSIFEFLLGLGVYFGTQKDYHKYGLEDIYTILNTFANNNFPKDHILKEMVALDYYLHFKVKPKNLFLTELENADKAKVISDLKLNHHKFRHVILPLSFDYSTFKSSNTIQQLVSNIVIQYDGREKAMVLETASFLIDRLLD